MRTLNLVTDGIADTAIKRYLENNVSEELANKINNGTPYVKDGKTLLNKKDLQGFMRYATEEAKKMANKGAASACVDDLTVFGWAIHYFEEDSIAGTLYTADGNKYVPEAKQKPTAQAIPKPIPKPLPAQQSMFELLGRDEEQPSAPTENNDEETPDSSPIQKETVSPLYTQYREYKERYQEEIVAMRIGDFYEIFDEDAVLVAKQVGLTLSSREVGLESRVPMIGYPYHRADEYHKKLAAIRPLVVVEEGNEQYYPSPETNVDMETGEVKNNVATFDDENLYILLRKLKHAEVR